MARGRLRMRLNAIFRKGSEIRGCKMLAILQ
jgi:hypothetical protein